MDVEFKEVPMFARPHYRVDWLEPEIENGLATLKTYNSYRCHVDDDGHSNHRFVNSLYFETPDTFSVLVVYYHRKQYGYFWRHWMIGRSGKAVTALWNQLTEEEKKQIQAQWQSNMGHYRNDGASWKTAPNLQHLGVIADDYLAQTEQDEQGTLYGYKYLCALREGEQWYRSPVRTDAVWVDNEFESDVEPTRHNTSGIYCIKNPIDPKLSHYGGHDKVLVKMALSGTVVEADRGFRAQHATIIAVVQEG